MKRFLRGRSIDIDKTLFILGAKDPEMDRIEHILRTLGLAFVYSKTAAARSRSYNAYYADYLPEERFYENKIFIECNTSYTLSGDIFYIDHHHKEDFGFHYDSKEFIKGSSIGQLLQMLLHNSFERTVDTLKLEIVDKTNDTYGYFYDDTWYFKSNNDLVVKIPEDIVYEAAADHSLSEAYFGLCPGIDPQKMYDFRIRSMKNVFGSSIKNTLEKFSHYIPEKSEQIQDFTSLKIEEDYSEQYIALREVSMYKNTPIALVKKLSLKYLCS